ncbi:MAG: hypothetical protein MUF31_10190 [Akkermansiaceae bacterium]|jgi:hypothetical protein|nr:hypothetical protein [Akkermansiaceae bacterium]
MKHYSEMAELMRIARANMLPSQLAHMVILHADGDVGQFYLITVFAEAFPEVPLQQIKRASRWHRVCNNGMSDAEFDAMLSPWFGSASSDSPPQEPRG